MKGRLTLDHTPYITIVMPQTGNEQEYVVDTGFNGALYLAEDRTATLNLRFLTSAPMILANQSVIVADIFEATIMWFSIARRVATIAGPIGCDALVGMELLKGCQIEFDDTNGEVRIEQL